MVELGGGLFSYRGTLSLVLTLCYTAVGHSLWTQIYIDIFVSLASSSGS